MQLNLGISGRLNGPRGGSFIISLCNSAFENNILFEYHHGYVFVSIDLIPMVKNIESLLFFMKTLAVASGLPRTMLSPRRYVASYY